MSHENPSDQALYELLDRAQTIAVVGASSNPAKPSYGIFQKLLSAGVDDLQAVEGVGELRARSVREGLSRLAESTILERYV